MAVNPELVQQMKVAGAKVNTRLTVATIDNVVGRDGAATKLWKATFEELGQVKVNVFEGDAKRMKPGDADEAVIEVKENGEYLNPTLQSFGPKKGGGRGFTPKSREEIHAPQIGAILVACINASAGDEEQIKKLFGIACQAYDKAVAHFGGQK